MSKFAEIKKFVKEHKVEVAIGAITLIGAGVGVASACRTKKTPSVCITEMPPVKAPIVDLIPELETPNITLNDYTSYDGLTEFIMYADDIDSLNAAMKEIQDKHIKDATVSCVGGVIDFFHEDAKPVL